MAKLNYLKNLKLCLITMIFSSLFVFPCSAEMARESEASYTVPYTESTPSIDGKITDGEWGAASLIFLDNETEPSQNVPAIVDTEVLIMEDGANIYLAFIASDPEPADIRAFFSDRDACFEDDRVGVVFDTFNDEHGAFQFFSNPLGVQMDGICTNDIMFNDYSWNAIWESTGKITDTGFIVEMRIPLDQLRFSAGLDKQIWGVDLVRFYPRSKGHRFSNNTKDYNKSCYLCQLKKIEGFEKIDQKLNLRIVPTLTGTYSEIRPATGAANWQDDYKLDGGVDIRWGINEDSYLNATINPDFSQVEADVAKLDVNNTFALYFPERREFFLEGADYFKTAVNLVHSRNITSPDFGIKLTGKRDVHTYGLFFTNDEITNILIPGQQGSFPVTLEGVDSLNTVIRYRSDINRDIKLGVILTNRDADGYKNTVAGFDGDIRLGPSDRVRLQLMNSHSEYPDSMQILYGQKEKVNDYAYLFDYSHDDFKWFWSARYEEYGDDFRADMGFINRVDYNKAGIEFGRKWLFGPGSHFNRIFLGGGLEKSRDEEGGNLGNSFDITLNVEGPMQSFMFLTYRQGEELYNGVFFDKYTASLFGRIRPLAGVDISLDASYGDDIDYYNTRTGRQFSFGPWVDLRMGKHFKASLRHTYQKMEIDGQRLYSTNLSDLRFTYQFTIRSFLRITLKYSDTKRNSSLYIYDIDSRYKDMTTQFLYSYKITPQTRFFIGFSDTGFQDDQRGSMYKTNRTLFTKISYEL
ncbi:MAG: carbohydrate binding family 9 domain-containing protein [Deltaproteobacteria bacterium]|nr:carbohydrate binding family 9 domain-containing protein [Deltaproteobacteria bacterium]